MCETIEIDWKCCWKRNGCSIAYLSGTNRIPLIAFNMSRTDSIDGGCIWMGGKSTVILPLVQMSFIFFCKTTACCVRWRRQPDDSLVLSWFSPIYRNCSSKFEILSNRPHSKGFPSGTPGNDHSPVVCKWHTFPFRGWELIWNHPCSLVCAPTDGNSRPLSVIFRQSIWCWGPKRVQGTERNGGIRQPHVKSMQYYSENGNK